MKIKIKHIVIVILGAFVFSLAITSGGSTTFDKLGITGYYYQVENILPFALLSNNLNTFSYDFIFSSKP